MYQHLCKVYNNRIVFFDRNIEWIGKRSENGKNLVHDREKAYQGEMNENNVKRIKNNIESWCNIVKEGTISYPGTKKKLVMLTVTLSGKQDWQGKQNDKWVKENLLEPLLQYLRRQIEVENYFWRAEPQRNGNVHFHILTDKFIDKWQIQKKWNEIQRRFGFTEEYEKRFKKKEPPSTDIRIFDMKKESIQYVMKYVFKKEGSRKIDGMQMRCSNKLKQLEIPTIELSQSEFIFIWAYLESLNLKLYRVEHAAVFYFDDPSVLITLRKHLGRDNRPYYRAMFYALYVAHLDLCYLEFINYCWSDRHLLKLFLFENHIDMDNLPCEYQMLWNILFPY